LYFDGHPIAKERGNDTGCRRAKGKGEGVVEADEEEEEEEEEVPSARMCGRQAICLCGLLIPSD